MKKIRCAIYTRKSAEEGLEQDFNSLDVQREACAAYVASPQGGGLGAAANRSTRRDEETGETTEFRSELLPRYARRTREVDEAILGTYLSGANSRRIRKALKPLLGEEHLSKSAVSRVVSLKFPASNPC